MLALALVGAASSVAIACDDEESAPAGPLSQVVDAAGKTIGGGPAEASTRVVGDRGEYAMRGVLDPSDGYRLCAEIQSAPEAYLRARTLWLEGRDGTYGTLTSARAPCPEERWLDDHPPTLPLSGVGERLDPEGGETGAEDFLHAALLALTQMESSAVDASLLRETDDSTSYEVAVDFGRFDKAPPVHDEDTWTLRPLVRSLGRYPVGVRIDDAGFIESVRFAAPGLHLGDPTPGAVSVLLRLANFGNAPGVPQVEATAIE